MAEQSLPHRIVGPFDAVENLDSELAVSLAETDEVLRLFGRARTGSFTPVADSTLNLNFRVETGDGPVFLRQIREHHPAALVEAEHRLISWAAAHGLPVCQPIPSAAGTVVECRDRLWALFPWVDHASPRRATTPSQAATFGDLLGRLHFVLAGYSDPVLETPPVMGTIWDTERSSAVLSRIDDVIRYYPAPGAERLQAQGWLREQLTLLESGVASPPPGLDALPCQICHGDFSERNVLLDGAGKPLAVIDWELARFAPRGYDFLRALDFMGLSTDPGLVAAFASGYGRHLRVDRDECSAAVELWWQNTLHNTWTFAEIFIRGHAEVARFLPEIAPRLRRLSDPGFRQQLASQIYNAASGSA